MGEARTNATASENSVRRREAKELSAPVFEKRHLEILAAAAEVLRVKGFAAANMQDVANKLGVDRSSLYYYFANKEQLYHTVINQAIQKLADEAAEIRDLPIPVKDKLRRLIYSQVLAYADHSEVFSFLTREEVRRGKQKTGPREPEWVVTGARVSRTYNRIVREILQQGLDEGAFVTPADARVVGYAIQGMGSWMSRWLRPDETFSLEEIAEAFAQMVLDGLRPRGGRRPGSR